MVDDLIDGWWFHQWLMMNIIIYTIMIDDEHNYIYNYDWWLI
jgi:hypothetical protein